jgi:hypothetical protein
MVFRHCLDCPDLNHQLDSKEDLTSDKTVGRDATSKPFKSLPYYLAMLY